MAYTDVLYERKNQIAWLTINRPDKGNSFRRQTILELLSALNDARHDPEVRVVVLSGAGDRFFCIGGEKEPNDGMLHYHNVPPVVDLYTLIDMMPVPVIAMVNGFAVGGGNVLANMCDLTVASEQATFRRWARLWDPTTQGSAPGISRIPWAVSEPGRSGISTGSTARRRPRRSAS